MKEKRFEKHTAVREASFGSCRGWSHALAGGSGQREATITEWHVRGHRMCLSSTLMVVLFTSEEPLGETSGGRKSMGNSVLRSMSTMSV